MRIAFLCSSVEPGRDGVGDYTRRLVGQFIRHGHPCIILGLNDAHVSEALLETQENEGTAVLVMRLPRLMDLNNRVIKARTWLNDFDPDWMSLQYVCYGYHPRGLAWRWNRILADLATVRVQRHLMFHELWSGEGGRPPLQHRLLGLGQRYVVRDLHRRFRPDVVTTSMPLFQHRLSLRGIKAKVLPLFGNISYAMGDDMRIASLLRTAGSQIVQKPRADFLNGVFFGTVHPDFDVGPLVRWLRELRSRAGKPIVLSMIGRLGTASDRLAHRLMNSTSDVLEVVSIGEQPEGIISQALQFADFGISTGSPELLGKSGTLAAMREHALPVVVPDGELDSTMLQSSVAPVVQFSTNASVMAVMKHRRAASPGPGVKDAAVDLIHFFEKARADNHSARERDLVKVGENN